MSYGFRYWVNGRQVSLEQIAGGGRIMLLDADRRFWSKSPNGQRWEIYETTAGHRFPDLQTAQEVLDRLNGIDHGNEVWNP